MLKIFIWTCFCSCKYINFLKYAQDADTDGYTPHDRIKETTIEINLHKCKFSYLQNTNEDGGAILITFNKKANCTINDCKFKSCSGSKGGAISASYSKTYDYTFTIIDSSFEECTSTDLGGAIHIMSGQPLHHVFNITGCRFINNKAATGGGIYAELRDQLTINNCHFENNEATNKGSSAYLRVGHNNIKNAVEEHDTFYIMNNVFIFTPSDNNKVNLYLENKVLTDETDVAHANVYFGGCTFSSTNANIEEYKHIEIVENEGGFETFTFNSCNCVKQGENTISIPPTIKFENIQFECLSLDTCTPSTPSNPTNPTTSPVNPPTETSTPDLDGYTPHDRIKETTIEINLHKCKFSYLQNTNEDGGAILITFNKKANCTINDCKFKSCSGSKGGAISASYSKTNDYTFTIIDSSFEECSSTDLGGAIHIMSGQPLHHVFNITGCRFINNKAATGGGIYAELRDQLTINNCHFENNEATNKGSSAYLRVGHNNIKNAVEEHDTFYIMNNVFIFTPSDNNKVNLYLENKVLTDETDVAHANVYFGGCTFSSTNTNIEEYKHIEIVENEGGFETFTFNSCNCVKQGENTISIPPTIKFENIQFECLSLDTCTPSTPSNPTNPTTSPVNPPTETSTPDLDGYTPHDRIKETTIEINLHKCKFSYLQNTNEDGGAILITFNKKVNCTINDCKFKSCSGSKGGAISASYSKTNDYTFTIIDSSFEECSSTDLGGAIHIISGQPLHHVFNITGCRFINNKAATGGGIYAELRDQLTINNCHFENNEATNKGSSAYLRVGHNNIKNTVEEHDTFYIMNNVFIFTPSDNNKVNLYLENKVLTDETDVAHANVYFGGCTFSSTNTNIEEYKHIEIVENEGGFETFTFNSCNCVKQGENTISIPSTIKFENIQFGCLSLDTCTPSTPSNPTTSPVNPPTETSTPDLDGYTPHGRIKETTIEINLHKCKFSYLQNTNEDGGAILITFNKKVNCTINDCKFKSCSGSKGGAISASYSKTNDYTFTIIDSSFEECSSTDLGGAIHIISGQPLHHVFNITGCRFINNKATTGGGIYAELRDQLTINNCHFENNEATNKGSSAYLRVGHNNIKNAVEEHDTFYIMNNVFIFTPSDNNKVNLYLENKVLTDETDVAHANVYFGGCTFSSTNANIEEYKHIEIVENEGGFETFTFNSCNCVKQGENTISIPPTIKFENIQFGCLSLDTCTPSTPSNPTTSPVNPPTETSTPDLDGYTPHGRIKETTIEINLHKCKFSYLQNTNEDGGAILITFNKKVNCTINDCKFKSCSGSKGGAISASYSKTNDYTFTIIDSSFEECSSTDLGGAIHIISGQPLHHVFNITGCRFINNKATTGGGIYAELRDQLTINNCHFENNEATNKGSSAYLRVGHNNIKNAVEEHDTFYIMNNVFIFTPSDNNKVNLYLENKVLTDETDVAHANVYFGGCTFSSTNANIEEYKHIEIVENEGGFETFTFNSCNCVKQGENTISIPPTIKFENIQFGCLSLDTCTPSTPSNPTTSPVNPPTETSTPDLDGYTPHGRIKETTIEINLHKCKFSYLQNTNEDGGAILITFNKKVNCTINDCKFKSCSGSKGGAISASYSKTNDYTFTIIDSSFEECSSTDLGGAIHIISGQPLHHVFNITGCRFINNKATTGGGIYAELRDQLTINNCHFENNEATNKGSSAYLRVGHNNIKNAVEEHDTFYIMNNVFIFTPSDNNKVNLYLENKVLTDETDVAHANVYFGGCTFSSTNANIEEYKHIEIVENEGGFETFTFNSCNCVKQGENTISIPPTIKFENIQFGCLSLDTCTPSTPSNPTTSPVNPPTETSTPDLDGYTPHGRIKETTIEINLHKCKFSYLQNTNEDGGAILITFNKKVNCTINDCKFKSCSGSKGGAISASYSKTNDYTFTIIDSSFEECSSTDLGGAIHIISGQPLHHVFNITGCRFINNKATTGGGIYAELRDQLTINNCHFENNEATNKGSSAYLRVGHNNIKNAVEEHDTFYIMNNVFIFTPSDNNKVNLYLENKVLTDETDVAHANVYFGGCTFSSTNANIEEYKHIEIVENEGGFETFTFNSCNCVKQGENTISIPPTIKFENIQFGCLSLDTCTPSTPSNPTTSPVNPPTETSTPDLDGYTPHGRIKETTIEINLHKCKFSYLQNTNEDGGAILITFNKKVNCTINDCKFKSCSGSKGGAISASYSKTNDYTFTIIDSSFEECSSTDLGGAIHIISGQPLHHVFNITGCRFINNKATTGGGIYAELRDQLTINNCHFENNEATNKGSSAYLRVGHNNIKNAVEEHDTFYIMNNVFIFTPSDNNKVNLYLENKVLTDETDVAHANVYFGGCTFSSTNTNIEEYKHIEIVENEGGFETFTFNSCNCVKQGENTISIPSTIKFENIQFGCLSLDTCTPSTPSNPTTSPVNPPTETSTPDLDGYTPHGRIKETTIEINLHKCKFSYLQNTNEDGGAILITFNKKVNCTINDCKFKSCSGSKGGAISASYSKTNDYTFTIIDSSFEECSSTDLGGAIHIISGQPLHHVFNITGCRFINNKAATGGGIYAELRDQLTINNCHFENNEATNKGSSAYLRVGHNNIKNTVEEHDTFYIMNNVFIFTPSDNNKVNLYLENKVLTDETDVAHANVYFGGCTFSSTNTNIEEYKHIEIVENEGGFETFTFNSCNCVKQGENTISIPPTIKFENIQFGCLSLDTCTPGNPTTEASTSHSASSPTVETSSQFSNTDVIPPDYTTQSPTDDQCESYPNRQESVKQAIKLEKACFFNLHSPNSVDGGAISAINASLELENCQFTKCSSSGNGGAIYVTFSSPDCELEIEECIFNSCSSGKFGGSIYFTSSNPRAESSIEECKFEENKAQQGAGAIYYSPCANSEMKDNLFVNNYCNNDNAQGSSLYVIIANQSRKKIKDDDDEEIKAVVIENNRIRSKPVNNSQQLFIDLKKDCELYFNSNSFSFDKTNSEDIPSNAKYIHLSMENSSVIHINGEICVDNKDDPLVEGFDSDANIVTDCHKADSENDQNFGDNDDNKSKDKSNLALIIGVAAAGVVVVVVIVLVVVLIVLRKKSMGRYIEDINTDDIADNSTTEGVSTADNIL